MLEHVMPNSIRLIFVQISVCVFVLQGCGGVRLQTPSELADQIKKGGQYDSEKRCDRYPYTSIEYQNCRQDVRKVYDELERKQKADDDNSK
jgi:hypothetical protein